MGNFQQWTQVVAEKSYTVILTQELRQASLHCGEREREKYLIFKMKFPKGLGCVCPVLQALGK